MLSRHILSRSTNVIPSLIKPRLLPRAAGFAALLLALGAQAQPGSAPPERFGDRQSGRFGDPGQGYFGNPGAGDFDKNGVKLPPVGAHGQGLLCRLCIAGTLHQSASAGGRGGGTGQKKARGGAG